MLRVIIWLFTDLKFLMSLILWNFCKVCLFNSGSIDPSTFRKFFCWFKLFCPGPEGTLLNLTALLYFSCLLGNPSSSLLWFVGFWHCLLRRILFLLWTIWLVKIFLLVFCWTLYTWYGVVSQAAPLLREKAGAVGTDDIELQVFTSRDWGRIRVK